MLVKILLSSYNGEKYLKEQIDSLIAQKCSAKIEILVRDDGSKDSTDQILDRYQQNGDLIWYKGENLGCGRSFWDLILNSGDADYYAFCDQDDYWQKDKIEKAVLLLEKENKEKPLLYTGNYIAVDKELKPIKGININTKIKNTTFGDSLIRSLSPGCTFVFNKKACEILRQYSGEIDIHDWMAYKIIAGFGKVIYDANPYMLYRQHGHNVIGISKEGFKNFCVRVKRFFKGSSKGIRSKVAKLLIDNYGDLFSKENKTILHHLADYKNSCKDKINLLKDKNFDLGNRMENLQFAILVLLNKV